jgi:hypothetical protein
MRTDQPSTLSIPEVEVLAPPPLEVPSIELNEIDLAESIRLPRLDAIAPLTLAAIEELEGDRQ